MSATNKPVDLGRISIYDVNTDDIELSPADLQLKTHTGYDDDHLRRLKSLFQQATGPSRQTLNKSDFESAARSLCRFLTESSTAHHLAEVLFQIYDKNTNGLIDFAEMVDFVWTVVDAPREEQIASLYQALRASNETLLHNQLAELLTIFKEDFQSKPSSINKGPLNTGEDIRQRVEDCLRYYQKSSEGLNLEQLVDYFLGSKDPLALQVKARWNARMNRDKEKKNNKKDLTSSLSALSRNIKRTTSAKPSSPHQMARDAH